MTSPTTSHSSLDDFLSPRYHEAILEYVNSPFVEWFFNKDITGETNPQLGNHGFTRNIWTPFDRCRDPHDNFLLPLFFQISDIIPVKNEMVRARIDMTLYNPEGHQHKPHVDDKDTEHWAAIYYVNDSDGDTILYNEKAPHEGELTVMDRITPKANRLLIFDGATIHTGHSPSHHANRVIINSNYELR